VREKKTEMEKKLEALRKKHEKVGNLKDFILWRLFLRSILLERFLVLVSGEGALTNAQKFPGLRKIEDEVLHE